MTIGMTYGLLSGAAGGLVAVSGVDPIDAGSRLAQLGAVGVLGVIAVSLAGALIFRHGQAMDEERKARAELRALLDKSADASLQLSVTFQRIADHMTIQNGLMEEVKKEMVRCGTRSETISKLQG